MACKGCREEFGTGEVRIGEAGTDSWGRARSARSEVLRQSRHGENGRVMVGSGKSRLGTIRSGRRGALRFVLERRGSKSGGVAWQERSVKTARGKAMQGA